MTESSAIDRNVIRADDTASWKLVLKDFLILREHFETQSEVPIQAASAGRAMQPGPENARTGSVRERGGPVRRGGEPGHDPGRFRDDAGRTGLGQVSGRHGRAQP